MSQKQLNRFAVISMVIAGHLTNAEAALSLGISERQIIRLKKGVIAEGATFLIHKNTHRIRKNTGTGLLFCKGRHHTGTVLPMR